MTTFPAPDPPFLGPAKFYSEGGNKPIARIVVHSTVGPTKAGSARGVAAYFKSTVTRPSSAHYVVDAAEEVQVVFDSDVAFHAPPNTHSVGVEMCDYPTLNLLRWYGKDHRALLARTARLVAELCLAYDVPAKFLNSQALVDGGHGITTHHYVSEAWHETDHWDPGAWPRRKFMREVRRQIKEIKAK